MTQRSKRTVQLYRRTLLSFLLGAALLAGPAFAEKINPEKHHGYLGKLISQMLVQYHYSHLDLDDSLSAEIYKRYVERLDYNRHYLLAEDVRRFEPYEKQLDDLVASGDLTPIFNVFNVFKARVNARYDKIVARLDAGFEFERPESYNLEQEKLPWAETETELDERWRKRLKHEALNLRLSGKDDPGIVETLSSRYNNFKRRIGQYDSEEVFELFMNAVTQSLDPHTSYFSPINSENFGIRMALSFEGIGARLLPENEFTKVFEIIPGGPADLDGRLQPNDYISGVDQHNDGNIVDVVGWKLDDVVQLIRGKRGTKVRLQILPGGATEDPQYSYITLVRDKVKLEERAAKSDTLQISMDNKKLTFGVIDIPAFYVDFEAQARRDKDYKSTTRDVKKLIGKLRAQNIDGLIIDLRGNGGGSLQEAISLTGLFIDKGPIVQVRDSRGRTDVESDTETGFAYKGPLIVMVDRLSASASEIFAGAIQDYGRGLVVGSQTFGKGTVQQLLSLDRPYFQRIVSRDGGTTRLGRVKVTMAKFYRVTGASTQHRGVIPDITFPSRYTEMELGEDTQINALVWDQIRAARYRKFGELSKIVPALNRNYRVRTAADPEFKFLREDIEEYRRTRDKKSISLQETVRRDDRRTAEARRKAREEARRAGLGLPPKSSSEGEKGEESEKQEERPDVLLLESARILADAISLSNDKMLSSRHENK